ncbi:aspartate/glutamate racemase family protein [Mesorhizobium sp. B283B1A]|uniref:aspartate/glutamate racemase family protein n=1 Tax=Mesorhizobium TaxID=68287 RepID=UPI001CD18388|nr:MULTISPECIES: aspartate/glutamate racemase family protein [Mesorhizobium]MCA0051165.1 aspartate/glutamate racemase family protein [Mesorhizobium sp. B283B1A]UQS64567.1 aspartate/glutamate racemase family protein [Mesorhizobium opportunistum]
MGQKEKAMAKGSAPTLGVALMEYNNLTADYGQFSPTDRVGLGSDCVGSIECPASWPFDTVYAVARGGGPRETLAGADSAVEGITRAVHRLESDADLVIANCGFFWCGWKSLRGSTQIPVLLSGLDFLDLALSATAGSVGVLTYSKPCVEALLRDHSGIRRMRIVGFSDLPSWKAIEEPDCFGVGGWTEESLREEFLIRLKTELNDGSLKDVRALVIECVGMPKWRSDIRKLTNVPIFDLMSITKSLLA